MNTDTYTNALAEIERLRASNAELLAALEAVKENMDRIADTNRKWTQRDQVTYERAEAAIRHAKGE